jgi:hypothetical protein
MLPPCVMCVPLSLDGTESAHLSPSLNSLKKLRAFGPDRAEPDKPKAHSGPIFWARFGLPVPRAEPRKARAELKSQPVCLALVVPERNTLR